ncbi:hypothetical protein RJ641_035258 [Dillenia turbinata]|uniref:Uncharacterized protein n=1 Tax=Dillenia turbinata TaxID=194707 RepID=A0AAN8ZIC4_9MAGN
MAARQGPVAMAAPQICLQVWLAVSLLTDALAASGQLVLLIGISLAAKLGASFWGLATFFTKDMGNLKQQSTKSINIAPM